MSHPQRFPCGRQALALAFILLALGQALATAFNALHPYEFDGADSEGWSPVNFSLGVAGGLLNGSVTAPDPQMIRIGPSFSGVASSGVLVRYRGSTNGSVQLFWGHQGADFFSAGRVATGSYTGDGAWRISCIKCQTF